MATDRELAAQSMMQAGIGSLSGRPDTTYNGIPAFNNAKSNYIFGSSTPGHAIHEQNRWEEAGGRGPFPVMKTGTEFRPTMDTQGRIFELYNSKGQVDPYPMKMRSMTNPGWMEAGITNPNLGGYKVMDAGDLDYTTWDWGKLNPFSWFNKLKELPWAEKIREEEDFLDQPLNSPERDEDGNIQPGWELRQQKNPETGEWETWWEDTSIQANIPNWYKWYDKLINRFGEERGSQLWHQYANRGGIMGLI